jgi:O-methyltransferase involved in polyketide biosynthesis
MSQNGLTKGAEDEGEISPFDTSVASQARIYDYLLGGKDNFAADREAATQAIAAFPGLVAWARNNRAFLDRAVRYLVSEAGVRQFLDIGTGLPTAENTHEVAQRIAPESRIVYVDNDPVVLVHARALLTSSPEGATAYIQADLRDPETIVKAAAGTLDFTRPVALMLLAVLHVIPSTDEPWEIVARIMTALPSGSYLAISHPASDIHADQVAEMTRRFNRRLGNVVSAGRTREEVARFFAGLDLVPPGIVPTPQWRPAALQAGAVGDQGDDPAYAAVGRKP